VCFVASESGIPFDSPSKHTKFWIAQTRLEDGAKDLVGEGEDTEGFYLEQLIERFAEDQGDTKRDPFGWVATILVPSLPVFVFASLPTLALTGVV